MELKVWVEGIQRVVCGATYDTTCQDVVIALAHAMGRTGRFTLIEKWRDNDRPLTPAECPLQVLHKWGEYAAEVRFVLCQADSKCQKVASQDRLVKKGVDRSGVQHRAIPPPSQNTAGDSSVKRSLTFSGAHNQPSSRSAGLSSSASTTKFRKTHLGPVPNGDVNQSVAPHNSSKNTSTQSLPRQARSVGSCDGHQVKAPSTLQQSWHPDTASRQQSAPSQQGRDIVRNRPTPSDPLSSSLHLGGDINRVSAFQPPQSVRSHPLSSSDRASHPLVSSQQPHHPSPHHQPSGSQHQPVEQNHRVPSHSQHYLTSGSNPQAPPLSTLALPSEHSLVSQHGNDMSQSQRKVTSVERSVNSHQASLEIEEYDLDHNFPDTHRDSSRHERPEVSLEYRLEDGLSSGSGGQPEGEHAKLMRLVNMQQQRLRTQESQISLINTEISTLEEEEKEYEENLHVIMEELLLQENRGQELEPQLNDLERVEWESVLESEKQQEVDLTLKIATCKAMILEHEHELDDVKSKESELLDELQREEESISKERERLKEEETQAREEESKTREEISQLQNEFTDLQKRTADCENSLAAVDSELNSVEKSLEEKSGLLNNMEAELKVQNMKDFTEHPVPKESPKSKDSEQVIMKILEGQLSPRLAAGIHRTAPDNPSTPSLLAALAATNQSGVWV